MADPNDTAPTAPSTLQERVGGSDGSEAGVGGSEGSAGLQAAPRGRGKPKRDRRAQRHPGAALIPFTDRASRRQAWEAMLADVAGGVTEPPLPVAVACRRRGLPLRTVEDWIAKGEAADLEAARAEGLARCLRGALMGSGETARQWAWLAERLAPKELHLPTKVHTGQDADAAPMQVAALVVPADPQAIRAELRLVQQQIAGLLGPGSDDEGSV